MCNFIFFLLFPLLVISQNSDGQSSGGFQFYNTNKSNNNLFYQTIGSRFYHEKFLTSIINGKKAAVKFDTFKDAMYVSFNDNYFEYLLPSKNNITILLDGKKPWLVHDNRLYRLLFER